MAEGVSGPPLLLLRVVGDMGDLGDLGAADVFERSCRGGRAIGNNGAGMSGGGEVNSVSNQL